MAGREVAGIELDFTRGGGKSRRAKIKSFWEFIDCQKELVPLRPAQGNGHESRVNWSKDSSVRCDKCLDSTIPGCDDNSSGVCAGSESPQRRRIWFDELRILKELGLDRVALAASNTCKRCVREEQNMEVEPEFADSVPPSYQELTADLKAFQERVKHQKSKPAYEKPAKYQHLIP
ncbi:uncharacterized protein LOC124183244 [Neodiprion fabricii]|uniref:uncharacterized protein LOC124183244 n=1 Tax=Neodiprion fabricii TaxID=2872261 RepID=UPI001ED97363|nr:uncharacterized protein LOC124183244 [Neodiprion fabricii]